MILWSPCVHFLSGKLAACSLGYLLSVGEGGVANPNYF